MTKDKRVINRESFVPHSRRKPCISLSLIPTIDEIQLMLMSFFNQMKVAKNRDTSF